MSQQQIPIEDAATKAAALNNEVVSTQDAHFKRESAG